jgi:hypothetical protein
MPNEDADAIRELALKLCGVCAQAKNEHDLCWSQLYFGLSLAMRAVMRSCDCVECRRHILRHVRKELPSDLRDAVAYSKDKSRCGRTLLMEGLPKLWLAVHCDVRSGKVDGIRVFDRRG